MVIALARLLGASGYGNFIAALAIATFFSPLASLGAQGVLLRDSARHPEKLAEQLGSALHLWLAGSCVFGILATCTALLFLPGMQSNAAVAALILSEVSGSSLVDLLARTEQSQHRVRTYGAITSGPVAIRLLAFGILISLVTPTVTEWMWFYAASSSAYSLAVLARAQWIHKPVWMRTINWHMAREGVPFLLGALSMRLQAEFSKPILGRIGYSLAGNFNVAQRALDVVSLPLSALLEALAPRLYADERPSQRVFVAGGFLIVLALAMAVALTLGSPLLPRFLGSGFEATASLIVMLAWLPSMQVLRNLVSFHVISQKRAGIMAWAYLIGAGVSIIANSILISEKGLIGAVIAAYLTESMVIATQIGLFLFHLRKAR